MCGIVGIIDFNGKALNHSSNLKNALKKLRYRGPDHQDCYESESTLLGHTRLSIIDISDHANQPFYSDDGRYTLIFNGEIFNFKELKNELIQQYSISFKTSSDVEVLFHFLIRYGVSHLKKLNGFFAFAFYDKLQNKMWLARDHFGIKPLYYALKENQHLVFSSEMKALLEFPIKRELDQASVQNYFHLMYIPAPYTIFKTVRKLEPGQNIEVDIDHKDVQFNSFYSLPPSDQLSEDSYESAQHKIHNLLTRAVELRMVSDVPLGSFLSGGIDSSIISTLAQKISGNLNTFSIGYSDEPYFDETPFANLVAKKIGSNHTVFSLSNKEMFEHIHDMLDYIDEPFADSSSVAVYILSKYVRKHIKVVLTGDGADELFSGYHKHMAEYLIRNPSSKEKAALLAYPVSKLIPASRTGKLSNLSRQIQKFKKGSQLDVKERYWQWAGFPSHHLLSKESEQETRKEQWLGTLQKNNKDINDMLLTDMQFVLPNDMLYKVDMMSMANSLEARPPFLDYNLVDYVSKLPGSYKIERNFKKKILQDTFKMDLPNELYRRSKKGFEIPLQKWLTNEMKPEIDQLLSKNIIQEQGIFNWEEVSTLKNKLFSKNSGDAQTMIWAIVVFQSWWKKYMN